MWGILYDVCMQVSATCMYVANMSFFAKVSDPAIGGTYMTLLNTVTNFGNSYSVLHFELVD